MFKPKYPNQIRTAQQLSEFMNYVVNGLADEVDYQVEFYGVELKEDYATKTIEVNIPIKVPKEKSVRFPEDFGNHITVIVRELKHHCCCWVNLKVNLGIKYLPEFISAQIVLSKKEENKMHIPEVEKIIHKKSNRGEFFAVHWKDNTKTTVKLAEGDESDEYTAFLYALGKRLFEDKGKAREFIKEKKKVFEDRMAKKRAEKQRQRKEQALRQSLEHEDIADISGMVYDEMFVAPCLVSRAVFRRNR